METNKRNWEKETNKNSTCGQIDDHLNSSFAPRKNLNRIKINLNERKKI